MKTFIVNLWGGPGTGKSTNAALVFGKLKVHGVEAELVHEYAKDLTWEKRKQVLGRQSYVMAKQQHHVERVLGQVEVIVTDSPLPFGIIYKGEDFTPGLERHIFDTWLRWQQDHCLLNYFLVRDTKHHPYVEAGRNQTQQQAEELDDEIAALLEKFDPSHSRVPILGGEETADYIVTDVLTTIGRSR